ncbi:MAG: class I tRNA ligase family protein, partial [Gammaproteobacteria bacterium]|nr:class I tRNA ligase family protein [Gammaproteobacteria bacterium]
PCPKCGKDARRETDTFDTFMESSWYYARFACPDSNKPMLDERVNVWAPVDHYVGGIEHAILHLLYARLYYKLLRDEGMVEADEPFTRLLMLGMVLQDGKKMSKSAGDAGDPQHLLESYGADAVRTAMMFAAPPDQSFEWNDAGVDGQARFFRRLWKLVHEHVSGESVVDLEKGDLSAAAKDLRHKTYSTLERADDDFGRRVQFNTVVSGVHELVNTISKFSATTDQDQAVVREALKVAMLVLSPIAPHITQALWAELGEATLLIDSSWPEVDTDALVRETVELIVQVNGKVRGRIDVNVDAIDEVIETTALGNENVARFIEDKTVGKVIIVSGKLVNIVVS